MLYQLSYRLFLYVESQSPQKSPLRQITMREGVHRRHAPTHSPVNASVAKIKLTPRADVAKLADAPDLGSGFRKEVEVQVLSSAPLLVPAHSPTLGRALCGGFQ